MTRTNPIQIESKLNPIAILLFHTIVVAAISAPFFMRDAARNGWNCVFAGMLVGLNLLLIYWMLKRLFQKKSIALITSAIVFKYAALLGLLFLLERFGWRMNLGFAVGVAALFPTLGFVAYKYWFNLKDNLEEQTNA